MCVDEIEKIIYIYIFKTSFDIFHRLESTKKINIIHIFYLLKVNNDINFNTFILINILYMIIKHDGVTDIVFVEEQFHNNNNNHLICAENHCNKKVDLS